MTRLLIKLIATADHSYEMEYHKDLQGLIYNLLRGSEYDCHNKQGYKFFTFSNIFPFSNIRKNDFRNLMISSPNDDFISYIKEQLEYLRDIRIGTMTFKVECCNKIDIENQLSKYRNPILITGTPILMRIHRYRYEEARTLELVNDGYESIYWRRNHPVDLFINQLETNLLKKYDEYYLAQGQQQEPLKHIFYRFKFLKQISTKISTGTNLQKKITVIGTNWQFMVNGVSRKLVRFALDTGLGELNSLGFGFMNVLQIKR